MKDVYYNKERSGLMHTNGMGLVHAYYGQGAGKTSRVLGLAVRAAGAGLKVWFVQFMKSGNSSEARFLQNLPGITYRCPGKHPFVMSSGPRDQHFHHAQEALAAAYEAVEAQADVLICDEILNTLVFGILSVKQVLALVHRCRGEVELIMTGVDAPLEIKESADYVTEFVQRKHPYYAGQQARRGIEY
ncbi:MAG: cob(I)yrinic acid a,c-diamide adenosyltransferase [Deltaproteobacteria bacterium]|nr:cob(I)yrinic acid a,c-diamide adenosyltransferase [Deltaproteobacteria bacterium]